MVNYQEGKIYRIICNTSGLVYYGSTCEKTLARRLTGHVKSYKHFLKIGSHFTSSFQILEGGNYSIHLVEKFPCNDKMELEKRERWYIENNECVNRNVPARTTQEYYEANKLEIIEKTKQYKENHKEHYKELHKIYYQENKEKFKEYKQKYYEENIDAVKEMRKQYYEDNKNEINAKSQEYYKENLDTIKEQQREHYIENKEEINNKNNEYYDKNKETIREKRRERCQCDCGGTYTDANRSHHLRTKYAKNRNGKHIKTYFSLLYINERI